MLFYTLFCLCFSAVLAPKTETKEKTIQTDAEKSEAIFADVIKNISRVNNVLQELINNYEQLQKIYKSQENFDNPEYSSEADADRFFKNNKKSNRNKERSFYQYSPSSKSAASYLHATQMILYENDDSDKSNETTPKPYKENKAAPPKVERLTLERKPGVQKNNLGKGQSISSDDTSSAEETVESTTPTTSITTTVTAVVAKSEPEIIFVDTHKKVKGKLDKKKPRIMPEIALEQVTKKLKTRYSVKEMPGNKDASYGIVKSQKPSETKNTSKSTSKRFLQIELLPTNEAPSEETVTNKPKESVAKQKRTSAREAEIKAQVNLRSHGNSNKSAKVFVANDVNKPDVETSSEMTDDDEALTKDLFKTSVLRQAYGDACLKLVVRKCYKACKQVLKTSCRAFKCTSDIKELFDRSSRTGCILHFNDTEPKSNKCEKKAMRDKKCRERLKLNYLELGYITIKFEIGNRACKNVLKTSCRAIKCRSELKSCYKNTYKKSCDKEFEDSPNAFRRMLKTEGVHVDLTRAGYLSVACQPRAETGLPIALQNDPTPNNDVQKIDQELNILRDRYEKACQKISQDKCQAACNYAQNATCVKFECGKSLKKNFRRNCGVQCKMAYTSSSKGSGSSDSDSSDSDSESDSDDSSY